MIILFVLIGNVAYMASKKRVKKVYKNKERDKVRVTVSRKVFMLFNKG